MKNPLAKVPFLFFLIPLLTGILLQYYFQTKYLSIAITVTGSIAMLFSYFIKEEYQFRWRWLFGSGVFLFIVGVGIVSTTFRQEQSEFQFSGKPLSYKGIITDSPQEKKKTIAYKVYLPDLNKHIVCYFQKDTLASANLEPGTIFLFDGEIQPFRNMGEFDYARYMYNQGFVGSVYLPTSSWQTTEEHTFSIKYKALSYRRHIMDFYKSLGFSHTEYSILSALTLGYQDDLSDDIKQGFRTTGTVHVLSVSGLHVGIIYAMIAFLLSFIRKGSKYYWIKPTLIILLLWGYAFITGLPVSVIRASGMLSLFCLSEIFMKKNYSIHSLYITAFFILLINPFSLFDIGFQLSFLSVLSILYLHPKLTSVLKVENKYLNMIWQLFALSLVAQLATFPLCLYYFGTFPTYFFLTNLLIVPLVTLITYAAGGIILAYLIGLAVPDIVHQLYFLPVTLLQLFVKLMTAIIRFFESLPFALVNNIQISFTELIIIYTIIISLLYYLLQKNPKGLITALSAILLFFMIHIYTNVTLL